MSTHSITVTVNGEPYVRTVEARLTLADYLRREAGMAGIEPLMTLPKCTRSARTVLPPMSNGS